MKIRNSIPERTLEINHHYKLKTNDELLYIYTQRLKEQLQKTIDAWKALNTPIDIMAIMLSGGEKS
jgi:protoheme ferro-lyase